MFRNIKNKLLHILPKRLVNVIASIRLLLNEDYLALRRRLLESELHGRQLALYTLRHQFPVQSTHTTINTYELSVYSQNGEDGILFYLFSLLGTTNRRFIEFGIADGRQCNTANLSLNFGWVGLLLEGDTQKAVSAQNYYQEKLGHTQQQVNIQPAFVTTDNINHLIAIHSVTGEIDLLSIDIDGNDYWVWQAITVVQPRLVVIEYNASLGDSAALTVVYDPDFDCDAKHPTRYYHGASLAALTKLGQKKGYVLVGCDSSGTNAFFVRQDVAAHKIKPASIKEAYFPNFYRAQTMEQVEQYHQIAHLPFHVVE